MTERSARDTPPYVEPAGTATALRGYLADARKRLLLFTGVSGVGKTTVLRRLAHTEPAMIYVDASVRSTPLAILQGIYEELRPGADLLKQTADEYKGLYSVYLTNVGNVTIKDSTLVETVVKPTVAVELKPSSAGLTILYQAALQLVLESLVDRRCLVLDQFEGASDNQDVRALIRALLSGSQPLCCILSSKRPILNDFLTEDAVLEFSPQGLSATETTQYMGERGIGDTPLSLKAFQFSGGHPLFLRMFADFLQKGLDIDSSMLAAAHEDRFELLVRGITNSLDPVLKRVFYYLPLCRVFSRDLVSHLFHMDSFRADQIACRLADDLYAEPIAGTDLLRFHELFTNLKRREIARAEQVVFDRRVVDFYEASREQQRGFKSLHELVEPFYHLQYSDGVRAFAFFERYYKPLLDRKQKGTAGILVGQVRLELVDDARIRKWYLLRLGGYFREFAMYDAAEPMFRQILELPNYDKKLTAFALNNLGICYMFTGGYAKSLERFRESNAICDELGLTTIKAHNANNMGICYGYMGESHKSREAYEEAYRLYSADHVEGLFLGKLLQNYAGHLEGQRRYEHAVRSAFAGEKEYLKDGDLVGGISCRLLAAENLAHQGRYEEAARETASHRESFHRILRGCGLVGERAHLSYVLGMIWLYTGNEDAFVCDEVEALALSLRSSSQEHVVLANRIRDMCIAAGQLPFLNRISNVIGRSPELADVQSKLMLFFTQAAKQAWVVRDMEAVCHRPGCREYQAGHYLKTGSVISPDRLLGPEAIKTCKCMRGRAN